VLRRHESAGLELFRAADRRRDLLGTYQARIDALAADVGRPLDESVKIFGRIYAREPVIALNQSFAELRDRHAVLAGAPRFTDASMQTTTAAERAFEDALGAADASLSRAQGGTWTLQLRGRLADVTAARQTVARLDDEQARAVEAFIEQSRSIQATIRGLAKRIARERRLAATAGAPEAGAPLAAQAPAATAPAPEAMTAEEAAALLALPMPAPAVRTITERITTESATSLSMLWVSLVVLGLMLVATIGTVLGVTSPVRRLTAATRRLARGDTDVSVPRGGARELDELGVAFNEMARELASARAALERQQQRLELEVAERTRDLQHLAENDPLTQLPNRRRLFGHLSAAIGRAATAGGSVAVMFLDVDNFKTINDSLNHEFGDEVLRQIGTRLRGVVGQEGFCARLGGDEFTVVLEGPMTLEEIGAHAARLIGAFELPLRLRDEDLRVTVSLGVSKFPEHAADAEGLLRAADTALFRSKERGRNQFAIFDQDMQAEAARKFEIEQGLHAAIARGELRLAFQPEVDLGTLETVTVEALLRWQRPDGRRVAPGEFLAVAEQSRLILDIGDWVMGEAIRTLAAWRSGPWPDARIAVNVSARQLLDGRFADGVAGLLAEHSVPPQALEIELTESVLQTGPQTIESLRALRTLGVSIALDDFGTGYSSLASLEQLPLTRVKLDRSLVAAIDSRDRSRSIARSIIGLCRGLGLAVTAEGVERSTQLALLAEEPGVTVQGFLLSRPVPAGEWLRLLPTLSGAMQSHLLDLPLAPLPSARPREAGDPDDEGRVSYG
jgi:diguanylate cyclase (GGDEF)-like protein